MHIKLETLTEKVIKINSSEELEELYKIVLDLKSINNEYYWYESLNYYASGNNFREMFDKYCFVKTSINKREGVVNISLNFSTKKKFCTLEELKQSSSQIWEF